MQHMQLLNSVTAILWKGLPCRPYLTVSGVEASAYSFCQCMTCLCNRNNLHMPELTEPDLIESLSTSLHQHDWLRQGHKPITQLNMNSSQL